MRIVVLDDGSWYPLSQARVCNVTDVQFDILEEGELNPNDMDLKGSRVVSEEERWVPIKLTSRSGKQQFVCTRCGRMSVTPDKICLKPEIILHEIGRLITNGESPDSISRYWKDWVMCGQEAHDESTALAEASHYKIQA